MLYFTIFQTSSVDSKYLSRSELTFNDPPLPTKRDSMFACFDQTLDVVEMLSNVKLKSQMRGKLRNDPF
jgi:hypothetical protein